MEGVTLTPIIGPRGIRYFAEEQIQTVVINIRRTLVTASQSSEDAIAAQAFSLLQAGQGPADLVIQLRLPPDLIEALHERWIRFERSIPLTETQLKELRRLFPDDPVSTEQDLLKVLTIELSHNPDRCKRCHSKRPYYCAPCAREVCLDAREQRRAQSLY